MVYSVQTVRTQEEGQRSGPDHRGACDCVGVVMGGSTSKGPTMCLLAIPRWSEYPSVWTGTVLRKYQERALMVTTLVFSALALEDALHEDEDYFIIGLYLIQLFAIAKA